MVLQESKQHLVGRWDHGTVSMAGVGATSAQAFKAIWGEVFGDLLKDSYPKS